MTLTVSAHVRWTLLDDRAILLCLHSGRYLGLDPMATLMWQGVVAHQSARCVCTAIAQRFQANLEDVTADYEALLATLRERGIVTALPAAHWRQPRVPRPSWKTRLPGPLWLQAWYSLLVVSYKLRYGSFATGYQYAARRSHQCRVDTTRCAQRVQRALKSFGWAENFFLARPGLDDCLARSLSLFVFLRQLGLPAQHHIGVRGHPFTAHAWVTVEGEALLEPPEGVQRFAVLACLS
jgi:hypothetical protein